MFLVAVRSASAGHATAKRVGGSAVGPGTGAAAFFHCPPVRRLIAQFCPFVVRVPDAAELSSAEALLSFLCHCSWSHADIPEQPGPSPRICRLAGCPVSTDAEGPDRSSMQAITSAMALL